MRANDVARAASPVATATLLRWRAPGVGVTPLWRLRHNYRNGAAVAVSRKPCRVRTGVLRFHYMLHDNASCCASWQRGVKLFRHACQPHVSTSGLCAPCRSTSPWMHNLVAEACGGIVACTVAVARPVSAAGTPVEEVFTSLDDVLKGQGALQSRR